MNEGTHQRPDASEPARPASRTRLLRGAALGAVALGMLGLLAAGTTVLHLRAAAEATPAPQPPVPVETVEVARVSGYVIDERFAGRLEPARTTRLAFERPGLVTEVRVEEGRGVARGEVIARLDTDLLTTELTRLEAERDALEADLELARLTADRQRELAAKGHSSAQRFDEARLAVQALEARIAQIDVAIARVAIDLQKSVLRAPYAGRVAARLVDEGTVVEPGVPIADLLENDRPQARIGISPAAAAALDPAQSYRLEAGATDLTARLSATRPDIAPGTRTVPVLFEVEDQKGVRFGDVIELVLPREVEARGFWLPLGALTEGPKGLWDVLTVTGSAAGPVLRREAVEVVHFAEDRVFVRGTLADGARVVAGGSHRAIPGQAVEILEHEVAS